MGVLITNDLSWSPHINNTVSRAKSSLGFIKRNLRGCPVRLRETAYVTLVRSVLEYAATIWDPHLAKDITALEGVQRKAARFVKHDYSRYSSVTTMLQDLGWTSLQDRRRDYRLALFYKVAHELIAVPAGELDLVSPARPTRANHKYKYRELGFNTTELKHFVIHRTISEWNKLPAHAVEAESLASFKAQLARLEGPTSA